MQYFSACWRNWSIWHWCFWCYNKLKSRTQRMEGEFAFHSATKNLITAQTKRQTLVLQLGSVASWVFLGMWGRCGRTGTHLLWRWWWAWCRAWTVRRAARCRGAVREPGLGWSGPAPSQPPDCCCWAARDRKLARGRRAESHEEGFTIVPRWQLQR